MAYGSVLPIAVHAVQHVWVDDSAAIEAKRQRGHAPRLVIGRVEHRIVERRRGKYICDPAFLYELDGRRRIKNRHDVVATAIGEAGQEYAVKPDGVGDRHEAEGLVVWTVAQAGLRRKPHDAVLRSPVGENNALGQASCPGGVEDDAGRFGIGCRDRWQARGIAAAALETFRRARRATDREEERILRQCVAHGLRKHLVGMDDRAGQFAGFDQPACVLGLEARIDKRRHRRQAL